MKKWLLSILALVMLTACSKAPVEKTQDPGEIEKLRKKHQAMAQRERADG